MKPASGYLNELIDYGGEPCTRAEAIIDMRRIGASKAMIDRWLQGYEWTQRLRERQERIHVRVIVKLEKR